MECTCTNIGDTGNVCDGIHLKMCTVYGHFLLIFSLTISCYSDADQLFYNIKNTLNLPKYTWTNRNKNKQDDIQRVYCKTTMKWSK